VINKSDEPYFYIRLGHLIKIARVKAKKSQDTLAKHLGLSRVSIVNIEKGRQKMLIHDLVLTAQFLDVSLTDLVPLNFDSSENTLEINLKNKINKQFSSKETQVFKVEDFVKLALSNFVKKDDK